jgi:malonyl CoA-acyl carrier protein transacylase
MTESDIADVSVSTVIITMVQIATIDLLGSLGVTSDNIMVRVSSQTAMQEGAMMAAMFDETVFETLKRKVEWPDEIFLSALNTHDSVTLAGTKRAIHAMHVVASANEYKSVVLKTINRAFHSPHVEPCRDLF